MNELTPVTSGDVCKHYGISFEAFSALSVAKRALYRAAYCADVLKIHEDGPPHVNRGDDVDRFNNVAGAALGSPWCAAFGTTMLVDSGCERKSLPVDAASVHAWREWAISNNCYDKAPNRSDFGLLIYTPTEGHLVMISTVDSEAGTVQIIAGNSNEDGSRDGWEVVRKTYKISAFNGFVSLGWLK